MTKTMIENWPDAIECGDGIKALFMLHGAGNDGLGWYAQVYPGEYRNVVFNSDGTFHSRDGHDASSRGCDNLSIHNIQNQGKAFNFVSEEGVNSVSSSMIVGWPDAIRCGEEPTEGAVFLLHGAGNGGLGWYVQVYPGEYRNVVFNPDGTFHSRAGHDTSSSGCEGKTIDELGLEDRTFGFISHSQQLTQSSMIAGWPDAIRCGEESTEGAVFLLHGINDIEAYYVQNYPDEYRNVRFNIDGSYNTRAGHDTSSSGCESYSIRELYEQGRAFNFVNSNEDATTEIIVDPCKPEIIEGVRNVMNIEGTDECDILTGNNQANRIFGLKGNDTIAGRGGPDFMDGGDGINTLDYRSSPSGVIIDMRSQTGEGGDAEGDAFENFQIFLGSEFDDVFYISNTTLSVNGNGGNDKFVLCDYNENLSIDGGPGNNTISYVGCHAGVTAYLDDVVHA